jgi:3-oxoacyl-(acyl-carrier-protein) synthase/acyl carrier protein
VELKNALERSVGAELPATVMFDYPSVAALTAFLAGLLLPAAAKMSFVDVYQPQAADALLSRAFAPVFISDAVECLPTNDTVYSSHGAVRCVPFDRWDTSAFCTTESDLPTFFGAFVMQDVALFDASSFNINAQEARMMDPQQRLLLEAAATSLSMSSVRPAGDFVGVSIGVQHVEYLHLAAATMSLGPNPLMATGGALSVAAGRLAYVFGLHGPAVSMDTACSASLVATHTAMSWLHMCRDGVRSVLVGGVGLLLAPWNNVIIARAGMLGPEGRCKTLDASADGYSRAEACGVLRLHATDVHADVAALSAPAAALLGCAINQDGRSSSLTAPSGRAQTRVIVAACANASTSSACILALEMHGTGTSLGDPIEVAAADAALLRTPGESSDERLVPLQLAAIKAHYGHAEAAAGIVGLAAAAKGVSKSAHLHLLHLRHLNAHLPRTPCLFSSGCSARVLPRQRCAAVTRSSAGTTAGVSSFAFQGTNAHAVVRASSGRATATESIVLDALWERQRFWFSPPRLWLQGQLVRAAGADEIAVFAMSPVTGTACALARQCNVLGQNVLPQAMLFEAALATVTTMDAGMHNRQAVLARVALPSPALLSMPRGSAPYTAARHNTVDTCGLSLVVRAGGAVEIRDGRAATAAQSRGHRAPYAVHFIANLVPMTTKSACTVSAWHTSSAARVPELTLSRRAVLERRAARRTIFASCGSTPSSLDASGYTLHPAVLESVLQVVNMGQAKGLSELTSKAPLLVVTAMRTFVPRCDVGRARSGAWASLQLPLLTRPRPGLPERWASDRLMGGSPASAFFEATGVVASALADQWRIVRDTTSVGATLQRMTPRGAAALSATATPRVRRTPRPRVGGAALDLRAMLCACVEDVVGREIDIDTPLVELGIDSITWVEIRNTVQSAIGVQVDVSQFVEAYSTRTLIEQLQQLVAGGGAEVNASAARVHVVPRSTRSPTGIQPLTFALTAADSGHVGVMSVAHEQQLARTLRARVDVRSSVRPLFLGAPAFGDGSLAYMSLAKALETELPSWNQAIFTLERDEQTPWPELAAAHASHMVTVQPCGPFVLGGHSLGGLLGLETATCLEESGSEVGVVFLVDSSHPQQFKVDWLDASEPMGEEGPGAAAAHDNKTHALKQLTIMMKALAFDFEEVGWDALSTDEKFRVFEDLSYQVRGCGRQPRRLSRSSGASHLTRPLPARVQALGKQYNTEELVEQLGSTKPLAEIWKSGIARTEEGCAPRACSHAAQRCDSLSNQHRSLQLAVCHMLRVLQMRRWLTAWCACPRPAQADRHFRLAHHGHACRRLPPRKGAGRVLACWHGR